MAIHTVRYIIDPPSACPPQLQGPFGQPRKRCEVDIDEVGLCAMSEILQTGSNAAPISLFFQELLAPGTADLVWRGRGPGRGTEMRRAFSGLFGRFFARAYLQRYHGFTWFAPIDGNPTYFSNRVRVRKKPGKRAELPDWLCAGPGRLAIAEAKGSNQTGNFTKGGRPQPIKTASGQISSVVVEKSRRVQGVKRWVPRSVKGWAVMSRWGVQVPPRDALQFVLDPETDGEPLSESELNEVIHDIARVHVAQILEGLGYGDLGSEISPLRVAVATRPRQFAAVDMDGENKKRYLGVVVGPFGPLAISIEETFKLLASVPDPITRQLRFVGIDFDVYARMRDGNVETRPTKYDGHGSWIGPDGMLWAPLDRVWPESSPS